MRMLWSALSSRTIFYHIPFQGVRSTALRLHLIRVKYYARRRIFTLEMKHKAEDQLEGERSSKVVMLDPTRPEDGPSSFLAGKADDGASRAVQKQKKKNGRTRRKNEGGTAKAGRRSSRRDDETVPAEWGEGATEAKASRLPKRQCALLIGFCGTGYSGMQFQPDVPKTIEGALFKSLVTAGAVSKDNADDPIKVSLARAARTDAGVHAAGNIVSMKMISSIPDVPDLVACVNELLPPEIRLWGYVRAQNSFNARLACDSRKYTYYFPSYILLPPRPDSGFDRALWQQGGSSTREIDGLDYAFWEGRESATREEDLARKRAWRVNPRQMARLREMAAKFEGTHNFHNFTVHRDFKDRSNQRYMKKIEVADPVVYGETEWVSVLFHGQSFMLHQIRKMMTALVVSCKTGTPSHVIDKLYGPRVLLIPKMPSLGLLLEEPVFDSYNERMAVINEKLHPDDPAYRPPIDFDLHREHIIKFKDDFIYKNMREVEDQTGLFDAWMRTIDSYSGDDLLYFNPKGIIPDEAVIQKGIKRDNPFREKKKFNTTGFPVGDSKAKARLQEEEDEEERLDDKQESDDSEG
ncbi:hypothetical protein AX15_006545 [Amanita polypyramis BW_CC]|nr:hypothetical protein AX15_006545 [Amanita polypyramis BW_CC]